MPAFRAVDASEAMLQEATTKIRLEFPFDKVRQGAVHLLATLPHHGPVAGSSGVQHGFLRAAAVGGRKGHTIILFAIYLFKKVPVLSRGACTTCPAGLTGTLIAIEGILKAEADPEIVVITV
jgi:hypothetical protein